MKDLAVGFVIYNPEESFWGRLIELSERGVNCFVYDNSPDFSYKYRDLVIKNSFIIYLTSGKNLGLGVGISSVCAQAYYSSFKSLVFFDQDTLFNVDCVNFINTYYNKNKSKLNQYSAIVFNSKRNSVENNNFSDVKLAISSGSLFNLSNAHKLKWHNENYFVDCVDYEFCYRSYKNNFSIGEYSNTPDFDHVTGQEDSNYIFLGYRFRSRRYSMGRICDTFTASFKLFFTCIIDRNFRFSVVILRSLSIYLTFQLLSRVGKEVKE